MDEPDFSHNGGKNRLKGLSASILLFFILLHLDLPLFGQTPLPLTRDTTARAAKAPAINTAATKAGEVVFSRGLLSVKAEDADLGAVLQEISKKTAVHASIAPGLEGRKLRVPFSAFSFMSDLSGNMRRDGEPVWDQVTIDRLWVATQREAMIESGPALSSPAGEKVGEPTPK